MITASWPCSHYLQYKLLKDGSRKLKIMTFLLQFNFYYHTIHINYRIYYDFQLNYYSILQDSMASTYVDEGPLPWYRVEMSIFYIVFFVVFPFFFVNIFVALIIVTFNELGEAELQDDMDKNQVKLFSCNLV